MLINKYKMKLFVLMAMSAMFINKKEEKERKRERGKKIDKRQRICTFRNAENDHLDG